MFGDKCMSRSPIFEWYKQFSEGREVVEDEFSGRFVIPTTDENITNNNESLRKDWRLSAGMMSDITNTDRETISSTTKKVRKKRPNLWSNNTGI
ncbi:hypothetical protein TNCV_1451281 [Trichonephila clavipes]|nr:hypothetical protein TNCV_1451281 [Trichonephila clavipes]